MVKKGTTAPGLLGHLPSNTPRVAIGIAVVLFALMTTYPMFKDEVSTYIDYRKAVDIQGLEVRKEEISSINDTKIATLEALATMTSNNSKILIEQAEKIGILSQKISALETQLSDCSTKLLECKQDCDSKR